MSGTNLDILFALASVLEVFLLCGAFFFVFSKRRYTFAESAAYAVILSLMAFSFIFQIAFIFGQPFISYIGEGLLATFSLVILISCRHRFIWPVKMILHLIREHPLMASGMVFIWLFLLVIAFLPHTHNLYREETAVVMMLADKGAIYSIQSANAPMILLNHSVLPWLFLRYGTTYGLGIFGFLAYLSIGFSTYALSRRFSWPPTAFTVAVVVASMPRFIYHTSTSGYEIIPATVAVFCLLVLYRAVERPNIVDLVLLPVAVFFVMSPYSLYLAFPFLLFGLSGIVLFRRHGGLTWRALVSGNRKWVVAAVFPFLVFTQVWVYIPNYVQHGVLFAKPLIYNENGIYGSLANLVRYFLESIHFTQPFDALCQWVFDFSIVSFLTGVYRVFLQPFFEGIGAGAPFQIQWKAGPDYSWFGPFGFLLIPLALFQVLRKAARRLKATGLAMVGYLYAVCLVVAWTPENVALFSIFFACSGFFSAFFIPPWRFTTRRKKAIQLICFILMVYSCYILYIHA